MALMGIQSSFAQSVLPSSLPAYTTINCYSKKFADAFSGAANQALLPALSMPVAGIYNERKYMLKELGLYAAAIAWPLKHAGFGIAVNYFGSPSFNTSSLGVGYGKELDEKISAGIQFNYVTVQSAGNGNSSVINVELGTYWQASEKICIGVHVYNPAGGKFVKMSGEKVAAVFKTGIGYETSDKIFTCIEIEKIEERPAGINAGLQYIFSKQFVSRLAIATGSSSYCIGVGWQWKHFRTDIVSSWHPQLGFTSGLLLLFLFEEDKDSREP
jgi:hypothetical protein